MVTWGYSWGNGPVSFIGDGKERRCHQDQFRTVNVDMEPTIETEATPANSEQEPSSTPPENELDIPIEPVRRTYPSWTHTTVQRYDPSW